jgi:hypothetical protein
MGAHYKSRPPVPLLSLILGYGPMAPIALAGGFSWFVNGIGLGALVAGTIIWSSALLIFLAGVRRGLSFFTKGGPQPAQIGTMFWLFVLGLVALILPYVGLSLVLLIIGYGSIVILDPPAAARGEAPTFFRRLRPPQMALALIGLIALLVRLLI